MAKEIKMVQGHDDLRRIADIHRIKAKLAVAKDIAEDFRENTSLGTIIREYDARIKEIEKLEE